MIEVAELTEVKALAEEYARRLWDEQDLNAIDEMVHPKVVIRSLLGEYHGADSMRKLVQDWLKGFPDLTVKNISVICEDSLVVIHWAACGTHLGEFKGVKPTSKFVSYTGVSIYRVIQGKIMEYWAYLDMQQLLDSIK